MNVLSSFIMPYMLTGKPEPLHYTNKDHKHLDVLLRVIIFRQNVHSRISPMEGNHAGIQGVTTEKSILSCSS